MKTEVSPDIFTAYIHHLSHGNARQTFIPMPYRTIERAAMDDPERYPPDDIAQAYRAGQKFYEEMMQSALAGNEPKFNTSLFIFAMRSFYEWDKRDYFLNEPFGDIDTTPPQPDNPASQDEDEDDEQEQYEQTYPEITALPDRYQDMIPPAPPESLPPAQNPQPQLFGAPDNLISASIIDADPDPDANPSDHTGLSIPAD